MYLDLLNKDTLPGTMQPYYQIEGRFAGHRALTSPPLVTDDDSRVLLQLKHFEDEAALEDEAIGLILRASRLNGIKLEPTFDDALTAGGLYLEREGIQPHTILLNRVHEGTCRTPRFSNWMARNDIKRVIWAQDLGEKFVVVLGEPELLGVLCVSAMDPLLAGVLVFANAASQVKIGFQRTTWEWLDEPAV